MPPLLVSLVACLAVLLTAALALMVGKSRKRYNVQPPATTGHPEFEKRFRAHQNTSEQLLLFLPSLLLFGTFVDSRIGAAIGVVWIAARLYYVRCYLRDPATRVPAVFVTLGATGVLLIGSIVGIVMKGAAWL